MGCQTNGSGSVELGYAHAMLKVQFYMFVGDMGEIQYHYPECFWGASCELKQVSNKGSTITSMMQGSLGFSTYHSAYDKD